MYEHYTIALGSDEWWYGLLVSSSIWLVVIFIGWGLRKQNKAEKLTRILFWVLLIREIIFHLFVIISGKFTFQDSLPLHLCGISYIFLLFVFYYRIQYLFEFLIMLSLAGSIQSLITPELTHGYSLLLYMDYYFVHSALFFLPIYCYFIMGMRLRQRSWLSSFLFGNVILLIVGLINYFVGANYIYLCHPPKANNPFITGGFPYHIIGFEIIGFIHIVFIYFIFYTVIPKYGLQKIKPK